VKLQVVEQPGRDPGFCGGFEAPHVVVLSTQGNEPIELPKVCSPRRQLGLDVGLCFDAVKAVWQVQGINSAVSGRDRITS